MQGQEIQTNPGPPNASCMQVFGFFRWFIERVGHIFGNIVVVVLLGHHNGQGQGTEVWGICTLFLM